MPGTRVQVRAALLEAARATSDVRGSQTNLDLFNAYFLWAANQVRALRGMISSSDLDRLVTTRRYWAMYGRNVADFGSSVRTTIEDEMFAREEALREEVQVFDRNDSKWGHGEALIVVPDTTVFVHHGYDFPEVEWHDVLGQRSNVEILLTVTMAAVRELDAKKLSRDNSAQGQAVRKGVHGALRRIEELFAWNDAKTPFITPPKHPGGREADVVTALLIDDLDHIPAADADGEMIGRGLALLPYSGRAMLVTFDLNQTFRARAAGLEAFRLRYDYETQVEPGTSEGELP
jgi:hypothetical protein